ncbi:hypothetical protein CMI37_11570 [Candidatus Pacearchaeota archaeon]|nr:hypothetical protein [Candidatus Pacearchaeota archaeon]|tara:strand:- start:7870 stop:8127 length:258 start_codon:yes stop_codon:yes gene_type:complete
MNKLFSADEVNKGLTKCPCGGEKEGWQKLCLKCYKKDKGDDRTEQIAYAQSWNLSVAWLAYKTSMTKSDLEKWQKYFYEKLTNRN